MKIKMNSDNLRKLCIKKKWFTCGRIEEYEKLLDLADTKSSFEDIARKIFLNSDDFNYHVILENLNDTFIK